MLSEAKHLFGSTTYFTEMIHYVQHDKDECIETVLIHRATILRV